jgi:hypothetical protein
MNEKKQPPSLEEEEHLFYATLGKAVTQWQHVEEALAFIFCELVGPSQPLQNDESSVNANAAFHAVLNFETKLGMTHSAFEWTRFDVPEPPTHDEIADEWNTLHNRAQRRAKRRNELVHFMIIVDHTRKVGQRCYLRPNVSDFRALMKMCKAGHTIERNARMIEATGNSFQKLGDDLIAFWQKYLVTND